MFWCGLVWGVSMRVQQLFEVFSETKVSQALGHLLLGAGRFENWFRSVVEMWLVGYWVRGLA